MIFVHNFNMIIRYTSTVLNLAIIKNQRISNPNNISKLKGDEFINT